MTNTQKNETQIDVDFSDEEPKTKVFGGSNNDAFNRMVVGDAINSFWVPSTRDVSEAKVAEWENRAQQFAAHGLAGLNPRSELEGMLASQIVAAHAASIECYRRAAISEQTSEGRSMNLNQAAKASRTFIALNESLMKTRGQSGKQTVQVHHHHHNSDNRTQIAAEQAVVNIAPEGEETNNETQPHEPCKIDHKPTATFDDSTLMRRKEQAG